MGKKATLLLTEALFRFTSIIVAILAVIGWSNGYISSVDSWVISMIGLGLMPILVLNFIIFIYWAIKRSWLSVFSLSVIILNVNFICAMIQFDFRSEEKSISKQIKVVSYNIHGSQTKTFNFDLKMIMKYLDGEGVDVICFQEFSDNDSIRVDSIFSVYPYYVILSKNKGMQQAVFSKYPLSNCRLMEFENTANCSMWVDVEFDSCPFRIINVHFQTTNINQSKTEIDRVKKLGIENPDGKQAFDVVMNRITVNAQRREEQVMKVREKIDSTLREKKPLIVCGDFNDTPASYTYCTITRDLEDGFKKAGSGYGFTYKAIYNLFRIDYIFYTSNFTGIKYYSPNIDWSDHNPVIVELKVQ